MLDPTDNLVQSFQLESSHLRGRVVRLGASLDLILHQHAYPPAVGHLLGEAVVLAAALASALKYEGVFTLQAKGDGVVRMLVVDVTSDGGMRAYAQFDKDALGSLPSDARLLGKGYMAFTCALARREERYPPRSSGVDTPRQADKNLSQESKGSVSTPELRETYQGIVALEGGTLSEAVQHYFRQSEQVPTGIMAAVECDVHGRWRGGTLLLQKMPREGGINVENTNPTPDAEDWTRAMMVMGTCKAQELTDSTLTADVLLFRLFHEEGVRVYEPHALRHQCRCSMTRVTGMLRSLPQAEIEDLAVEGIVTVTCEFCNKGYVFNKQERDALYADAAV